MPSVQDRLACHGSISTGLTITVKDDAHLRLSKRIESCETGL